MTVTVKNMEHQIKEYDSLLDLLEDLDHEGITGLRRQKIVNRYLMLQARMAGSPFVGSFELTPLCNFNCKMCYVHLSGSQAKQTGKILTTHEWKEIIGQAIDAGMVQAELTGGECTVHPGFREIYHYLISRGVRTSIMTNGENLDADMVEFLKQYRPERVQITVYGSNRDAYLRVTGRDAFDEVQNAIHRVKKAGIRLSLSIMPNRYMRDDVMPLLEFVRSFQLPYGVSGVTLPARKETGRKISEYIADEDVFLEIDRSEKAYRDQFRQKDTLGVDPYSFVLRKECQRSGMPCSAGHCAFHVNWQGNMTPCVPFNDIAEPVLSIGFEAAWRQIKDTLSSYREPHECKDCEIKEICQSCPAEKTSGQFNGALNHLVCEKWHRLIACGLSGNANHNCGQ